MRPDICSKRPGVRTACLLGLLTLTVARADAQATRPKRAASPPTTAATSLARYVPQEGLGIYFEFQGIDAHARAWERTAAFKALNETPLGALLLDLISQGVDAGRDAGGIAKGPTGDEAVAQAKLLLRRGAAMGFRYSGGDPSRIDVMMVFRGGAAEDTRKLIDGLAASLGRKTGSRKESRRGSRTLTMFGEGRGIPVRWDEKGDAILCNIEYVDAVIAAIDGKAKSAESNAIRAELSHEVDGFRPLALGFVDLSRFPKIPPEGVKLGLDGLKRIDLQFGFQDEALVSTLRLLAPSPRRGLLALLDQPTFDVGTLPSMPKAATAFTVASIDADRTYDRIVKLILATDPNDGKARVDAAERSIKEALGIDLRRDLLRHLGPKLAIFGVPSDQPIPTPIPGVAFGSGYLMTAEIKDRKAVEAGFGALVKAFEKQAEIEAQRPGARPEPPTIRKLDGPTPGWSMILPQGRAAPGIEPTVLVAESSLIVSPFPATARAEAESKDRENWTPTGDFEALGKRLPKKLVLLNVNDPRQTVPGLFANLPTLLQMAEMGMARSARPGLPAPKLPIRLDPALIPDAEELSRRMGPGAMSISVEASGIRLVNREMFPSPVNPGSSAVAIALLLPAVQSAREAARRAQCVNNEKQMLLAMHNYESTQGHLPRPSIVDKAGKPLLSWRVAILPYLDEEELHAKFHLDEPWDSPHNKALLPLMPAVYRCPSAAANELSHTHYRVVSGKGALFEPGLDVNFADVTDGLSTTLAVAESKEGIPWTKPEDLPFDDAVKEPSPTLYGASSAHPGGFNGGMADGSVRFFKRTIKPETIRALITRAGGETIELGDQF